MNGVNKSHFFWLDAIRFVAAFMVLLSHCRNTFFPEYGDLPAEQHSIATMLFTFICRMGHEAVIVFFVLSGFLVGGRGWENIKSGTMQVKSYAIDRFARIYPPLIAAVIFCGITSFVTRGIEFNWGCAIGNLLNLQGICCGSLVSPFWSLSYEVWFYIILGTLSVLLLTDSEKNKLISFTMFFGTLSVFVMGLKCTYLIIWVMGAIAYMTRPKKTNVSVLILSLLGVAGGILYYQLSKDSHFLGFAFKGNNRELIEMIIAFAFCLFIQQVILFEPQTIVAKSIEKLLGNMAKFSYTLYLSHRIVFLWIIAYIWPENVCDFTTKGLMIFLYIIALTLLCCYILYFVSERHTSIIKRKLKSLLLK